MPAVLLSPIGMITQLLSDQGIVGAGFKLNTYVGGTVSTPQTTYTDSTGTVQNANPLIMGSNGRFQSVSAWAVPGTLIKMVITDSLNNLIAGGTIDNIPLINDPASFTASGLGAVLYPQTAAELAAGVTPTSYAYPPYDIRRYGGDSTGVAASDTALTNALLVCGTPGGTIRFPNGTYKFANQYSLSNRHGIIFQGDGGPTAANTNGTILTYSGTASPWFNMPQAAGVIFKNMSLLHSNAGFTGTYLKYGQNGASPSNFCGLDDVAMGSSASNTTLLDLDATICFSAKRCYFQFGNPSVKGQAAAGTSYSNVISFTDCQFSGHPGNPVLYGGFSWTFNNCDFEAQQSGACGAFSTVAAAPCQNMSFRGCWFGDATIGGGTWIVFYGQGLYFGGNWIAGNATSIAFSLNVCSGVEIIGNYIASFQSVIDFTTGPITAVELRGNSMSGLTAAFSTTANAPLNLVYNPNNTTNLPNPLTPPSQCGVNGTSGWKCDPDGRIEQWGDSTVTTGTPLAIVFTKQFPTALWNVQLTLHTPVDGTNKYYVTSPLTTGFTANVSGTAGTNPMYWRAIGN